MEVGLAELYEGSDPGPLQMLLNLKEKDETEVEKLTPARQSNSGDEKQLQPSFLQNSPSPSEVDAVLSSQCFSDAFYSNEIS